MARLSDAEYILQQEIKEKKAAGRGAYHKKSGAKSKKCTLPSDHLTKKEREKLNGECVTYNLGKFMTWEEFIQMPDDLQLKYVNSLVHRFDVGMNGISKVLFGLADHALSRYMEKKDLKQYVTPGSRGAIGKNGMTKLKAAIAAEKEESESVVVDEAFKIPEPVEEPMPEEDDIHFVDMSDADIVDFKFTTNGFNDGIWEFAKGLSANRSVEVTITVIRKSP